MFARLMLIAGIAGALAAAGCSPETRYRTLSLFFDGVPDPAKQKTDTAGGGKGGTTALDSSGKPRFINHGPYAAQLCDACHRGDDNSLLLPVEDLCLNCHVLNIKKKHVHGPVASGGCRACHHPHGSGKQFLLSSEPTTFCLTCHAKAEVESREVHQAAQGTQCTECHDPHGSDNDFLMR